MRKIIIDGYEISVENGNFTKATFLDADGNEISINLGDDLKLEFDKRRKEDFKEQYEKRRHIDAYLDDYLLEIRTSNNSYSMEDELINEDLKNTVIQEIWNLPAPQNRRVFMSVINKYSFIKIAKIEGVTESAIRSSVKLGKIKLQKKLKNFSI